MHDCDSTQVPASPKPVRAQRAIRFFSFARDRSDGAAGCSWTWGGSGDSQSGSAIQGKGKPHQTKADDGGGAAAVCVCGRSATSRRL